MNTEKRDQFIDTFAEWLLESGHAEGKHNADRLAWDFIAGAWDDGGDDLDSWIAAYEDAIQES